MKLTCFKPLIAHLLLVIFIFTNPALIMAFKPKTHVWIAQRVLNDVLDDHYVTIEGYSYKISDEIYEVLQKHPNEYRIGSIGPDIFPDVVVGQMTIHPGIPNGWQSDDWLLWMMKSAKEDDMKSLAYGYFGHAASDIFAHTYVNTYAGDIFVLTDYKTGGKDSRQFANEEKRHFAIESLIAKHTPDITDQSGRPVEISRQFLSASTEKIAKSLILNDEVVKQYLGNVETQKEDENEDNITKLVTGHLIMMKLYRDRVKNLIYGDDDDLPLTKISNRLGVLNIEQIKESKSLEEINNQIASEKTKAATIESEIASRNNQNKEALKQSKKTLRQLEKRQKKQALKISKLNTEIKKLEVDKQRVSEKLISWLESIEKAIAEYVGMSLDIGIELTKEKGNPGKVVDKWRRTKAALFLPPEIGKIVIDIQKILEGIRNLPGLKQILARFDKIKSYFNKKTAEGLAYVFLGNQSKEILNIIFDKIEEDKFNEIFVDDSGKHLLEIPDAARRIKQDMFLKDGFFDQEKFSAVHNAIVLAKLSLLGPEQLNQLVQNHYGEQTAPRIFSDTEYFSILFGAVRSIDGDHQWNEFAPPYLRKPNYFLINGKCVPEKSKRAYGRKDGFKLWSNFDVREKVFRKIFKGPIAPSINDLIPSDYPYKPTAEDPFPEIMGCKGEENL